jgi:hypothetical protein
VDLRVDGYKSPVDKRCKRVRVCFQGHGADHVLHSPGSAARAGVPAGGAQQGGNGITFLFIDRSVNELQLRPDRAFVRYAVFADASAAMTAVPMRADPEGAGYAVGRAAAIGLKMGLAL